ncbi:SMI1/KNR4 family protein [Verrucomicrobiota bacterium sgz303538]
MLLRSVYVVTLDASTPALPGIHRANLPLAELSIVTLRQNKSSMSIDVQSLARELLEEPGCCLSPADAEHERKWTCGRSLPEDVVQFFSIVSGGGFFWEEDAPVPQVGYELSPDFRTPISEQLPVEDTCFSHWFSIGDDPETGAYSYICVSLEADRFGWIYRVDYELGSPALLRKDAVLLGRSFSEWLAAMIGIGRLHQHDWRAAVQKLQEYVDRASS